MLDLSCSVSPRGTWRLKWTEKSVRHLDIGLLNPMWFWFALFLNCSTQTWLTIWEDRQVSSAKIKPGERPHQNGVRSPLCCWPAYTGREVTSHGQINFLLWQHGHVSRCTGGNQKLSFASHRRRSQVQQKVPTKTICETKPAFLAVIPATWGCSLEDSSALYLPGI